MLQNKALFFFRKRMNYRDRYNVLITLGYEIAPASKWLFRGVVMQ